MCFYYHIMLGNLTTVLTIILFKTKAEKLKNKFRNQQILKFRALSKSSEHAW